MGATGRRDHGCGMSKAVDAANCGVFPPGLGEQVAFVVLSTREKACQGTLGDPEKGVSVCLVVSAGLRG